MPRRAAPESAMRREPRRAPPPVAIRSCPPIIFFGRRGVGFAVRCCTLDLAYAARRPSYVTRGLFEVRNSSILFGMAARSYGWNPPKPLVRVRSLRLLPTPVPTIIGISRRSPLRLEEARLSRRCFILLVLPRVAEEPRALFRFAVGRKSAADDFLRRADGRAPVITSKARVDDSA